MFRSRRALASVAVTAVAAAVVIAVSVTPFAAAVDSTSVEAESMTIAPPAGGGSVPDSTASAGAALALRSTSTASTTISLPASARVVVRAKAQKCRGWPVMDLSVDGIRVATNKVSTTTWTDYTVSTTIPAGSHTISVANTDQFMSSSCVRTLLVDKVTLIASATPTSTTPTTTTTGPPTTTTSAPPTTTTSAPPTTTAPPPPSGDNTAWLQSLFDQMKPGDTLTLSRQTYQHAGVLKIRVAGVHINGNGATLQATNDATSAVQIVADNVSVTNLTLAAPLTGNRWGALEQHKLVVEGNFVTVSDVTVSGSAAAGVFVYGAGYFTLNRVTVRNSRADGIHMTNGAHNGQVTNPTTEWTGDDGVAVVSYGSDPQPSHDIVIDSPTVNGTTWGRGLSVVGGYNITYRNIKVSQSNAAGIYIASEGDPYYTRPVSTVNVTGGTVTGANTNPQVVHGAVLVYCGNAGQSVSNVTVAGVTIANTPTSAHRNVGIVLTNGAVNGIAFNNIALQNTTLPPLLVTSNVPASSYTTSGWTLNGIPIPDIHP
jgi:hypothetical protein